MEDYFFPQVSQSHTALPQIKIVSSLTAFAKDLDARTYTHARTRAHTHTHSIPQSNHNHHNSIVNGKPIERVRSYKYQGIEIDDQLKFEMYVSGKYIETSRVKKLQWWMFFLHNLNYFQVDSISSSTQVNLRTHKYLTV